MDDLTVLVWHEEDKANMVTFHANVANARHLGVVGDKHAYRWSVAIEDWANEDKHAPVSVIATNARDAVREARKGWVAPWR